MFLAILFQCLYVKYNDYINRNSTSTCTDNQNFQLDWVCHDDYYDNDDNDDNDDNYNDCIFF
jgi:hypothetical protein